MARRSLIPIGILAAMGALAFAGAQARTYELPPHVECNYRLARSGDAPADILFIGNSRSGAAIDPKFVSDRLSEQVGRAVRAERIALTRPYLPQFQLISREYAEHRGYPDIVVLQLLYNRNPKKQDRVDRPIHELRNIAYGDLQDLYDIQADARPNRSWLSARLDKGWRPMPAVALDKFSTNIYAALRYPARAIRDGIPDCDSREGKRQSAKWLYDDLDIAASQPPKAPSEDEARKWRKRTSRYLGTDAQATFRGFENDQIDRLIAMWRGGGSRVRLVIYPHVYETLSASERAAIATRFPEAELVDGVNALAAGMAAPYPAYYRDPNHVNSDGALVISTFVAAELARDLSTSRSRKRLAARR